MRKMISVAAIMLAIFVLASPSVMAGKGRGAGEGNYFKFFYNWLRDDDGDGIPNCLDPDYVRPQNGTGYGKLGPYVSAIGDEDKDQIMDKEQLRDRDQLKDGSCDEDCDGIMYRLQKSGK